MIQTAGGSLVAVQNLAVAGLVGLAVGVEREWSARAAPAVRFAGVRTFLLLGLLGGLSGWLHGSGRENLALLLLGGGLLLPIASYWVAAFRNADSVDATTTAAALLVAGLSVLAGLGEIRIAGGAAAIIAVVLAEKGRLHGAVARIGGDELRAALHFAVLALVVMPLLPARSYGPLGGINPRSLWFVVLLFSGLNFAGYVARRVVGPGRGYGLAGILGGMISSTAVTLNFSRRSAGEAALSTPLAVGVIGACTVLLPRVTLVSLVLAPRVGAMLGPVLAAPFLAGCAMTGWGMLRRRPRQPEPIDPDRNPLRLASAIQMTIAFQLVLLAVEWTRVSWGSPGVIASAAFLGLTDVDALTLAMSRLGSGPEMVQLAAVAITVGILANTGLKMGLCLALGRGRYRGLALAGLAVLLLTTAASLLIAMRVW
jgi:uncharacterized membrane protein (DUF4010 family)